MLRRIWRSLVTLLRGNGDPEEDDGRFVPSPLDLSVRIAHGGRDDEIDRELARIHREADQLEDLDSKSR